MSVAAGVWQDRPSDHATASPLHQREEERPRGRTAPGQDLLLSQRQRPVRRKPGRPADVFREEDRAAGGETPAVTSSTSDEDLSSRGKHSGGKAHLYTHRQCSVKTNVEWPTFFR